MALLLATFFLASAGASSAYLTVSEIFPMETRALAIAFFYAIGTAIGGITGPLLFAKLIATGRESTVAVGFYLGAGIMILGGIVEIFLGVKAEGQQLEDIAKPLTAEAAEAESQAAPKRDTVQRGNRFSRPGWSPTTLASSRPAMDRDLDREVSAIVAALAAADGPMDRRTLAARVGAQRWGAGRFSIALGAATQRGDVRRVGRASYEATRSAQPAGRS
jgi:MFS family permease